MSGYFQTLLSGKLDKQSSLSQGAYIVIIPFHLYHAIFSFLSLSIFFKGNMSFCYHVLCVCVLEFPE